MGVAGSGVLSMGRFVGVLPNAWVATILPERLGDSAGEGISVETSPDVAHPDRNKARRQKHKQTRLIMPKCLIITGGGESRQGLSAFFQAHQALTGLHQGVVILGKAHAHEIVHWLMEEA